MVHQSWQWAASLKGLFTPKFVSRLPMWLATTSTMTRMPLSWQALTIYTKSCSEPKFQLSLYMSLAQQPWQPPSRLSTMGEIQMASKPMPWMQSRLLVMPLQPPPQQLPRLSHPQPCPSFLANRSVSSWQIDLLRHSSLSAPITAATKTTTTRRFFNFIVGFLIMGDIFLMLIQNLTTHQANVLKSTENERIENMVGNISVNRRILKEG